MLSGGTASAGKYPVEAVTTMAAIAEQLKEQDEENDIECRW